MIALFRFAPKFYLLCAALLVTAALSVYGTYRVMRHDHPTAPVTLVDTLYVEAKARTDTVRVPMREQIVRVLRDTLYRNDTVVKNDTVRVLVPRPTLVLMDSTIKACAKLDTLVGQERTACGRVQKALRDSIATLKPRFRDRFNCTAGVSVRGSIQSGRPELDLTCGLRVLP